MYVLNLNIVKVKNSLGRTVQLQDPDMGTWNYTYDALGNLLAQEGSAGELLTDGDYYREYNALHQLVRLRKGNNPSGQILEEYWYSPDGDRIKTVRRNGNSNTTIYTPFKEWMQIRNSTGTYDYTYIYDGNTLIARKNPDNTTWYYHDDHLGSTNLITDQNGNIVEETFYTPFGQTTSGGTREAYLLYTDQFKDTIGCYDYGARVYCPKWYHFTSADPITANVYDPQGLNRYAYVKNNPYVFVDPTGKKAAKKGAASGYGTGSARANAVNAGRNAAKSGASGNIYAVYNVRGEDGPKTITISGGSLDDLQEALKKLAEAYDNVYGDYIVTSDDSITYQNPGSPISPEAEEAIKRVAENPYAKGLATTVASAVNPELGVVLGLGVTGQDFIAKAQTGEIKASDVGWTVIDVGMTIYVPTATKSVLTQMFKEVSESKTVDFIVNLGTSWWYEASKSQIKGNQENNQEEVGTNG